MPVTGSHKTRANLGSSEGGLEKRVARRMESLLRALAALQAAQAERLRRAAEVVACLEHAQQQRERDEEDAPAPGAGTG